MWSRSTSIPLAGMLLPCSGSSLAPSVAPILELNYPRIVLLRSLAVSSLMRLLHESPLIESFVAAYTLHADAVAICSGLHVTPAWPEIPGIEYIPETLHSSAYKGREQLVGKRVMILGCGETAMDLAYESCKAGAKEVTLCYRGGYLSFPKVLNSFEMFGIKFDGELPIDGLITVSPVQLDFLVKLTILTDLDRIYSKLPMCILGSNDLISDGLFLILSSSEFCGSLRAQWLAAINGELSHPDVRLYSHGC